MPVFFVDIQFVTQPPCQAEAADKAVDGSVLCDLVFAVNDLQHQPAFRFLQPLYFFLERMGFQKKGYEHLNQLFIRIILLGTPSMSRRGNPYDNALAENFFSILKTECLHRVKIKTFAEARRLIDEYIYFYNHQRIQTKTKLTPMEFRCQYVA